MYGILISEFCNSNTTLCISVPKGTRSARPRELPSDLSDGNAVTLKRNCKELIHRLSKCQISSESITTPLTVFCTDDFFIK